MKAVRYISLFVVAMLLLGACQQKKKQEFTPWGTPIEASDSVKEGFTLTDIVNNGEMIMLTLSGPDTYFDYHGRGMGLQYMLCERFAQRLGVSLRVEVCRDTTELIRKLQAGDGDIAAVQLRRGIKGLRYSRVRVDAKQQGWAVRPDCAELQDSLDHWFRPDMVAKVRNEELFLFSPRSIRRHVFSPMLNRAEGVISHYDGYFQQYAPIARMDWRLMAAQCYQESCFDPNAKSWAGACGLMQIMPTTADHLGLPRGSMFNPEENIAASARFMSELAGHYQDVPEPERMLFQLASYNGGFFHIRDAMRLAQKYGRNPHRWDDVAEFILKLSQPAYYNDPVVKYGYMRGAETVEYVRRIRDRWQQYCGVARGGSSSGYVPQPKRANRNYRWHL